MSSISDAMGEPSSEPLHRIPTNQDSDHLPRPSNLFVDTQRKSSSDTLKSPSQTREQQYRLDDDLRMLQIERQLSLQAETIDATTGMRRERSRRPEVVDEFDIATNPIHESTQAYKPPDQPENKFAAFFIAVHKKSVVVRWLFYIIPLGLIILVPLLVGAFYPGAMYDNANVGGVELQWFMIWVEIVWLSLWAGRVLAKILPYPIYLIASIISNEAKKWRDMAKQLEMAATLFFWWLAIEISFLPTMYNHLAPSRGGRHPRWTVIVNKLLISGLVFFSLNFLAKIIIQLIAISFHMRTYSDRIELNKFQIGSLTKLYNFSKIKIAMEDSEFEAPSDGPGSGSRTPAALFEKANKTTKQALNKVGDVAGKVAGDFTGKRVKSSSDPQQIILSLLASNSGAQVLARRLYRTFARHETESVYEDDLKQAFDSEEEANAAFSMFDKDMNGDITMEELEAVCMEIGRERKSITASLKDLDSVVSKLDKVFLFLVFMIWAIVLISIISTQASGVLTSLGSVVLGLSWLFSATAQEFLQSIVFVFVKHPFDVGDRVSIYGNTGSNLRGDDYFVKEISLLYTEFKKMEGHIVQAPNSYLNTLFILNQRRSGGLAEAIPMIFKYGTTLEQIETLRSKLLDFVQSERREYQSNILTELREITEAHSITVNIVFFYKTNWQNELVRLQRRNKFHCAMMVAMQELNIQGPRMRYPGQTENFPVYMHHLPFSDALAGKRGTPDHPTGLTTQNEGFPTDEQDFATAPGLDRRPSVSAGGAASLERSVSGRRRGESLSAMGRRLDFSLGMDSITEAPGDVFEDRERSSSRLPPSLAVNSASARNSAQVERATSREFEGAGGLQRRGTANSTASHPNRFFGRRSHEARATEEKRMEEGDAPV